MKKKKVVRIITRLNVGGPAKHTIYLTYFLKEKFDSYLISGKVESNEEEMSDLIQQYNIKPFYISNLKRSISPVYDFFVIVKLFFYLVKFKPDIIHTHTAKAGTTGRIAAGIYNLFRFISFKKTAKVFHTFHGHTFYGYHNELLNKVFIFIERVLAAFFTHRIIVLNAGQYYDIVEKFMISSSDKVKIIPLGFNFNEINISQHNKNNFIQKYCNNNKYFLKKNISNISDEIQNDNKENLYEHTIIAGIVGRLTKIKNHFRFLDIVKIFLEKYNDVNIVFCIIGEGELKDDLKNYAVNNNIIENVIFTGNVNEPSLIYSAIDILLLTSDNEGTPLSIIESFSSKIPVISTDVGGVPDLLKKNRGIIVQKDDVEIFADKIKLLIDDTKLRQEIITNAYSYVSDNHSIEVLVKNMIETYE